jgi:hypothetical protein
LSTTNPTCCPDEKPGRRSGKPATNRLSDGTVYPRTDMREYTVPQNHMAACLYCTLNNMKACSSYFEFEYGSMKFTEVVFDFHNINVDYQGRGV